MGWLKNFVKNPGRAVRGGAFGGAAGATLGAITTQGPKARPAPLSAQQRQAQTFDPSTGLNPFGQTSIEQRSGIMAPKYEGARDAAGNLKAELAYDPTKSQGYMQLREQAMAAPGESPWAKMQLEKQQLEQGGAADAAAASSAQGLAQARALMMRQGGLNSGASARMGMQGAKDLALAGQNVARQGLSDRLGIQSQDIARKQDLLGNMQTTELGAQGKNIDTLSGDIGRKAQFDAERYGQQMSSWGADKTAAAQRAAAAPPKKFLGIF